MPKWGTASGVEGRLVLQGVFSTDTTPTRAQVEGWINAAEAKIRGLLRSRRFTVEYDPTSDGGQILTELVEMYATGWVKKTQASADLSASADYGEFELTEFKDALDEIKLNPTLFAEQLSASGDVSDAGQSVRSYVTDNTDGKSIAAGDFAHTIVRGEKF